jgi:hypothetical protein
MKSQVGRFTVVSSIAPAAKTATTNGTGVDLAGKQRAAVVLSVGTITDGTHTPKLQDSDDNSTFADTTAIDGTFAALATGVQQIVGYLGMKRYIRPVITVAGATTGGVYAANVVTGK